MSYNSQMATPKKNYIDNKHFEKIIRLYLEDNETYEEEVVKLFDLLITNILLSFKFKVEFDDAKQECFCLVLKTLKNFSPEKGSAFNYFTTVILNNLKLLYTKRKKYMDKVHEYRKIKGDFGVQGHTERTHKDWNTRPER